jgi:hypothetical protein
MSEESDPSFLLEIEKIHEEEDKIDVEIPEFQKAAVDETKPDIDEISKPKKKNGEKRKEKKKRERKLKEKFQKLPPKRQVIYLTLIVLGVSLILNVLFGVVITFAPNLDVSVSNGLIPALPGNFIVEIIILWALALVSFFVLYPFYPYISVLFVRLHNLIKLKKYNYSRVTTEEHYYKFKHVLNKVISPLLFSFVLGYWLATWILGEQSGTGSLLYFLYGFISTPIVVFLMSPLWLLDDAGIITLKRRREGARTVPDIEGVSVFFMNLFTGSAISLGAVTFVDFIIELSNGGFEVDAFFAFLIILVFMLPINYLTIAYLYENTMRRNKKKLHKIVPKKLVDMNPKTLVDKINFLIDISDSDEETRDKYLNLLVEMETKADEIIVEEEYY